MRSKVYPCVNIIIIKPNNVLNIPYSITFLLIMTSLFFEKILFGRNLQFFKK